MRSAETWRLCRHDGAHWLRWMADECWPAARLHTARERRLWTATSQGAAAALRAAAGVVELGRSPAALGSAASRLRRLARELPRGRGGRFARRALICGAAIVHRVDSTLGAAPATVPSASVAQRRRRGTTTALAWTLRVVAYSPARRAGVARGEAHRIFAALGGDASDLFFPARGGGAGDLRGQVAALAEYHHVLAAELDEIHRHLAAVRGETSP